MTDALQLDLTATEIGLASCAESAAKNAATIEALVPIARSLAFLADQRGEDGITVSELRIEGIERGLIDAGVRDRRLSYLGAVMKRAGLRNTGLRRRSRIEKTHGNLQTVWAWNGGG